LAALHKALEAHPECKGVKVSELVLLTNSEDGLANWDVEFTADAGTTMSPDSKRAALSAKQGIQRRFDLASEDVKR
jgi:hypothetical protein